MPEPTEFSDKSKGNRESFLCFSCFLTPSIAIDMVNGD